MDGGSSWLPFLGRGIGDGVSGRSSGSEVQRKEDDDLPISSQVEEELRQFYLLMGMERTGHPAERETTTALPPSSESSMFRSFPGSPADEASSLRPRSSNNNSTTANSYHHHPAEVSSQSHLTELSPVTYGGGHRHCDDHQCYVNLDTILKLDDEFKRCHDEQPHNERAQHKNGFRGGAFVPYTRHLGPKKKPKPPAGSGGQRAIKAAMAALARMHMVRLAQWQCYQMELVVAPAPPTGGINGNNQQQHVLSERKRREKLNDSFKALRTVLPPSSKKDKASTLMRARDYVSTLQSRVSELEEKNRMMLVQLQHRRNDVSPNKIEVDIRSNREETRKHDRNFT